MRAPFGGAPTDGWSAQITGYIYAPISDEYYFHVTADDGVQLVVDGQLIIDDAAYTGATRTLTGNVELTAGWYPITMHYSDDTGDASYSLSWSVEGKVPMATIPTMYMRAGTGPVRVDAWVKPEKTDGFQTIFSLPSSAGAFGISLGTVDGQLNFAVRIEEGVYREMTGYKCPVTAGKWSFVSGRYDGSSMYMNVDGYVCQFKHFTPRQQPGALGRSPIWSTCSS